MGNGQDVLMPWLNDWLLKREGSVSDTLAGSEVRKNQHPVPAPGDNELQASQNLFLLQAGCDGALNGRVANEREIVDRLKRERDVIGLWGSECTSPIYHHFIITGLSAIYHNTSNSELKDLIEHNLGSFFWYAIRMGLDESPHGLVGMRGTGHDFAKSGFPDLHFVCQYHTSGRPKDYKSLTSWKKFLTDSGWAFSGVAGGRNYELCKKVYEYATSNSYMPWRLRSKLTILKIDGQSGPEASFYEKGINGNTPALMAYVSEPNTYLPVNAHIRVRQKHDNASCHYTILDSNYPGGSRVVDIMYNGIYSSGEVVVSSVGEQSASFLVPLSCKLLMLTSSLDEVTGWVEVSFDPATPTMPSTPPAPPAKPKKKHPWWMFWK